MAEKKKKLVLGVMGVLALLLFLVWFFVVGIKSSQPGSFYNKNHNALWIGHRWVEEQSREDIKALVNNLQKHGIDTVFVHAGPYKSNGEIDPETYAFAPYFLEIAREIDQNIQYQAWLGQIRSVIDLDSPEVQDNAAKTAMIMTDLVGFDGVHIDVEPVWDEDYGFIEMLRKTRERIGEDKVISVALAEFIPESLVLLTKYTHDFQNYNTEVNYRNVSQYADQVVAMVYDTGIKKPWLYRKLVEEQVIWLSKILNGSAELYIGLPTYEDETGDSDFRVENIENGIMGVIDGLNNIRSKEEAFAGVALYSYWETDEEEWEIFENNWVK